MRNEDVPDWSEGRLSVLRSHEQSFPQPCSSNRPNMIQPSLSSSIGNEPVPHRVYTMLPSRSSHPSVAVGLHMTLELLSVRHGATTTEVAIPSTSFGVHADGSRFVTKNMSLVSEEEEKEGEGRGGREDEVSSRFPASSFRWKKAFP